MAEPLRTALVGFGTGGAFFHAPLIDAEPGLRLTTVVTGNRERAAKAVSTYPGVTVIDSTDALWERADDLDLVVVTVPTPAHAGLAIEALRRFMPGCDGAKLRNFGMTLGIRDTRKIDALYNLTGDDVRGQARFDDAIGIFPEFIDGYGLLIIPTTGRYFHIPYRAMLPKSGPRNLIVAGRSIGGDKVSHAAVRNMMACAVAGQGAGVAAAISVRTGRDFHTVDIAAVQAELRRQGARIV